MTAGAKASWLTAGISAIVSAAVAVLVAFATNSFQDISEHERWLRDQQQVAYTEFSATSEDCYWNYQKDASTLSPCISQLQSKLVAVDLVGTPDAAKEALETLVAFRSLQGLSPGESYAHVADQLLELRDQFREDLVSG